MLDIQKLYEEAKDKVGLEDSGPIPYVVETGSALLDKALGIGGYPGGRIIEVYGQESTGKTTLAMQGMLAAQKDGHPVAIVDAEHAWNLKYAADMGLGKENQDYFFACPDCFEQTAETIEYLLNNGVKFIVVDSVSAMTPKAELLGEFGEETIGLQARLMGQLMRKIVALIEKNGAVVMFINQIRQKIGVNFGSPETTSGGNALKFYATIRLRVGSGGQSSDIIDKSELIGKYVTIHVKKNKVGPPGKKIRTPIMFGKGFYIPAEIFDLLLITKIITKRSSFYYYQDKKIGAGKFNTWLYIEEHIDEFKSIIGG